MKFALDTNLLARFLLRDDATQHARALALLRQRGATFTAAPTVLLELVWTLEASNCSADEIASALRLLVGLPDFAPEHAHEVRQALVWYEQGIDFADALHVAMSSGSDRPFTFDRAFAKRAARLQVSPSVVLAYRAARSNNTRQGPPGWRGGRPAATDLVMPRPVVPT